MHEIAVTALFIAHETKETAERYVHHRFVKSYEDALHYQKYASRLNEKPFSEDEFRRIEADYKAVLARYGPEFRRNYAWAIPALLRQDPKLNGAKIGFEHLQTAVNISHWTPITEWLVMQFILVRLSFASASEAAKMCRLYWQVLAMLISQTRDREQSSR